MIKVRFSLDMDERHPEQEHTAWIESYRMQYLFNGTEQEISAIVKNIEKVLRKWERIHCTTSEQHRQQSAEISAAYEPLRQRFVCEGWMREMGLC